MCFKIKLRELKWRLNKKDQLIAKSFQTRYEAENINELKNEEEMETYKESHKFPKKKN